MTPDLITETCRHVGIPKERLVWLLSRSSGGWVEARNFLERRPENEDIDLAIRSEGGSE
jgi:hypothetical protein